MVVGLVAAGPIIGSLAGGAALGGGFTSALGLGLISGATSSGATLLAQQALSPAGENLPGIKPGDILRAALDIQALSEAGLKPVSLTDPFTGNLVVATENQLPRLFDILGERFAREELSPGPEEITEIRTLRDAVVQSLAMPTARRAGPGVVVRRSSDLSSGRRLGGPCAAANTGFTRLRCGRGGFS